MRDPVTATYRWQPSPILFLVVFTTCCYIIYIPLVQAGELCFSAQSKCVSRLGCSVALSMYMISCGSLLHGETDVCNRKCKQALVSLLTTYDEEETDPIQCDCGGNEFCENHKSRMDVCSADVLPALRSVKDVHTSISCTLAELICRADSPCLTALQYYQSHCGKLWRGERCGARCNNSRAILYRQPKAMKLHNCICDGTEEYPCTAIHENTERLCFHREPYSTPTRHRHHHGRNATRHNSDVTNKSHPTALNANEVQAYSVTSASSQSSSLVLLLLLTLGIVTLASCTQSGIHGQPHSVR